jgi:tetratricopeptide (TPR) repeat protein
MKELLKSPIFHVILLLYTGVLVYSNTFNAPLLWDESFYIMENPIIRDLSYFIEPSRARGFEQYDIFRNRYVGFLTFALNYRVHGLSVEGYHFLNLSLHVLNALLVYLMAALTFKSPFMAGSRLRGQAGHISLLSALFFLTHPVQTEAVNYIFQRLASMATLFYLVSLVSYIRLRLGGNGRPGSWGLYLVSIGSSVLAMKTKEIAFTLPLSIALYEFLFFRGPAGKRALRLVPLLLTMLVVPLTVVVGAPGEFFPSAAQSVKSVLSLSEYAATQPRVVITYLRLILLPLNQNFDYDYPVFSSFLEPQVFLSFLLLTGLFGSGVYFLVRSMASEPALRILAFGVFWFFLTLSVESSVIPIPMLINEYRLYLPSAGAFCAMTTGAFLMAGSSGKAKSAVLVALLALSVVLATATYARNALWRTESSLWEDVAIKSPNKIRAHNNLCNSYLIEGQTDKAIERCRHSLTMEPYNTMSHLNLGMAYLHKESWDKSLEHLQIVLLLEPKKAGAHIYAGMAYGSSGRTEKGIEHLETAMRLKPYIIDARTYTVLGDYYNAEGRHEEALAVLGKALETEPDNPRTLNTMGNAHFLLGDFHSARLRYRNALEIDPSSPEPRHNIVKALLKEGDIEEARAELETLEDISPEHAKKILQDKEYANLIGKRPRRHDNQNR